jgi:two-component system OmpR family response regulator/two-component system copper resistance phosphate regulon response regulator CusR
MDLLVIEDEAVLGKALQRGLSDCHHECTWVRNGKKGLDLGLSQRFDAIILDLLLPDMEGIEVLAFAVCARARTTTWLSRSPFRS